MTWTKQSLQDLARDRLSGYKLIVVSNREPYIHSHIDGHVEWSQPASGMAASLDPVMQACGGAWVAHGSGDADREVVDSSNRIQVPPDDPQYTLRRVWLTPEQERGYYYGLSNSGLWPLCHIAFTRPVFDPEDWRRYKEVNQLFADAVLEEAGDKPTFVFIQDYHFGLLPRLLKNQNPNLIIAQFWHIPWPNRETFRAFPWKEELLDGLLGNDLLGFHLHYHCHNFIETVDRGLEALVDAEHSEITRGGRTTTIRPFPISIDFEEHNRDAASAEVDREMERWRQRLCLDGMSLGIGIDRADYTKGIPDRLRALDHFFEHHPEHRERVKFLQVAVPTRAHAPEYKRIGCEIEAAAARVNEKWGTHYWKPVELVKRHLGQVSMMALHRLSSFCMVTSLHDGMNLVSKEFVASRFDENGSLILSQFAGAARELGEALLVNPFAVDETSDAIRKALEMPEAEQRRRMQRMRVTVAENNIYRWAAKIVSALTKFDFPQNVEQEAEERDAWAQTGFLSMMGRGW
jgi:alpha,alpha-trehalose-phosphate synthase [UDP-forming]